MDGWMHVMDACISRPCLMCLLAHATSPQQQLNRPACAAGDAGVPHAGVPHSPEDRCD
jgi:hypothetical protein